MATQEADEEGDVLGVRCGAHRSPGIGMAGGDMTKCNYDLSECQKPATTITLGNRVAKCRRVMICKVINGYGPEPTAEFWLSPLTTSSNRLRGLTGTAFLAPTSRLRCNTPSSLPPGDSSWHFLTFLPPPPLRG
ncbi:MAG: hypothetical protein ACREFM_02540 [Hypericibacter sp.]